MSYSFNLLDVLLLFQLTICILLLLLRHRLKPVLQSLHLRLVVLSEQFQLVLLQRHPQQQLASCLNYA